MVTVANFCVYFLFFNIFTEHFCLWHPPKLNNYELSYSFLLCANTGNKKIKVYEWLPCIDFSPILPCGTPCSDIH